MRIVDAHHHLWDPASVAYELLLPDGPLAPVARRFDAPMFDGVARKHGVTAAIAVEATSAGADPAAETAWMLEQVAQSTVTQAMVAWAPLEDPSIGAYLDGLSVQGKASGVPIVGVRRSFESAPDGFVNGDAVARGVRAAAVRGLVVDLVLFGDRLSEVVELVRSVPEASFVLDHLAKPRMDDESVRAWRDRIARLAQLPNVVAKVSGLATVATTGDWEAEIALLVEHARTMFGWERLMFASDWPICDLAGGYERWLAYLREATAYARPDERASFFAGTADRVYGMALWPSYGDREDDLQPRRGDRGAP